MEEVSTEEAFRVGASTVVEARAVEGATVEGATVEAGAGGKYHG
jgi:hypothetical protein